MPMNCWADTTRGMLRRRCLMPPGAVAGGRRAGSCGRSWRRSEPSCRAGCAALWSWRGPRYPTRIGRSLACAATNRYMLASCPTEPTRMRTGRTRPGMMRPLPMSCAAATRGPWRHCSSMAMPYRWHTRSNPDCRSWTTDWSSSSSRSPESSRSATEGARCCGAGIRAAPSR